MAHPKDGGSSASFCAESGQHSGNNPTGRGYQRSHFLDGEGGWTVPTSQNKGLGPHDERGGCFQAPQVPMMSRRIPLSPPTQEDDPIWWSAK